MHPTKNHKSSLLESTNSIHSLHTLKTFKAFTLVELIVVITILAILGTIGFISLQGYSSKSRDSTRASNLSLAARSLETYQVNASRYPSPDSITGTGQIGGITVAITGVLGDTVAPLVKLDKAPTDPLSTNNLAYGVDINNRQYQIAATFEGTLAFDVNDRDIYAFGPEVVFEEGVYASSSQEITNTLSEYTIPTVHAAGTQVARVAGNYGGIIRFGNTLYNPPALIFASGSAFTAGTITLTDTTTRFITNNGSNLPYAVQDAVQGTMIPNDSLKAVLGSTTTATLTGVTFSGSTSDWNTQSGTLATTLGLPKDSIGVAYYGTKEYTKIQAGGSVASGGSGGGGSSPTDWRTVDTNCTKPDITVGSQTWAGCNSTIGTLAIQYTQTSCYDYVGGTKTCTSPPSGKTVSTMTEADYQAGQSDNIYGAYYQYNQMSSSSCLGTGIAGSNTTCPCKAGYHVPTNAEWDTLMVNLGCSAKLTGDTTGWECGTNTSDSTNGLGWTSTNPNSLKTRLGLPLSGYCYGGSCYYRGYNAYYWSSTVYAPNTSYAWYRYMSYAYPSVYRYATDQSNAFAVRCVKD